MHAAPRTSLLLSQPLQALPLRHPRRVSEDGSEGCFSDWACKHTQLSFSHAANGQSAHQPAQQQQPTVGGSRIHKIIPDRSCPNWIRTQKLIQTPSRIKIDYYFLQNDREPTVFYLSVSFSNSQCVVSRGNYVTCAYIKSMQHALGMQPCYQHAILKTEVVVVTWNLRTHEFGIHWREQPSLLPFL